MHFCRTLKLARLLRDVEIEPEQFAHTKGEVLRSLAQVRGVGSSRGDATPEQCRRWRATTSDNVP